MQLEKHLIDKLLEVDNLPNLGCVLIEDTKTINNMVTQVTIPIKNNKWIKVDDLTKLGCVLTNTVTRIDKIPYFKSVEKELGA